MDRDITCVAQAMGWCRKFAGARELPQPSVWGDRSSSRGRRDSEIAAADTVDAVGRRGGFLCGSPAVTAHSIRSVL